MSELITSPATARTDTPASQTRTDTTGPAQATTGFVRRAGVGLALGAATFAATFFLFGPQDPGIGGRIVDLAGLAFQLGLFGLLAVMLRTGATGTSRLARGMLRLEFGLLTLASIWSVLHALLPDTTRDAVWLAALDVFWPLSMLGMFVIGIKVAVTGRWTSLLRVWPLVAESWAIVVLPIMGAAGTTIGGIVGGTHMLVGYAFLGVLLARIPRHTGAV